MNIRLLKKNDYKQYIQLISKFRPITEEILEDKFNKIYDIIFKNSEIYVADISGDIIGSITVIYEQKFIHNYALYAHIEDVFVDENYRNNKIGSILIQHVLTIVKAKNCFKCTLVCSDENKKFYIKNRFEERGVNMSFLI